VPEEPPFDQSPETIFDEWARDAAPEADNVHHAQGIAKLVAKYGRVVRRHNFKARKAEDDLKVLKQQKRLWIAGKLSREALQALGWPPYELRVLKSEIEKYVEADPEVIRLGQVLFFHQQCSEAATAVMWGISDHSKLMRNILRHVEFLAGAT
jgi:hypothetical protein